MVFKKGHKEGMFGRYHREESKEKMRLSKLGKSSWNKGLQGYTKRVGLDKYNFKKGNIPWNVGKHHSPESNEKNRLAHLGRTPWNKGKYGLKIIWDSLEKNLGKKTYIPWNKGKTGYMKANRTSFKKGQSPWNKGRGGLMPTPWNKGMKMSESIREECRIRRAKQILPIKDTSIEKKLHQILDHIHIKYKKHYTVYHPKMGLHQVDIMLLDHEGKPALGIEADGCYFHGCSKHHPTSKFRKQAQKRDRLIDSCLKDLGIKLIRLWEHDINTGKIPIELYQEVVG